MSRVKKKAVYRVGTEDRPVFDVSQGKVWLITNPALYYSLGQDDSSTVRLWVIDIAELDKLNLNVTDHPHFEGVCVVELKDAKEKNDENILAKLRSLQWDATTFQKFRAGMSLMNFSTLEHAIAVYLRNHRPTTPEQCNFQAELKAVCHWFWLDGARSLKPGPHDDNRIKRAAIKTLEEWMNEIEEMEKKKTRRQGKEKDDGGSSSSDEDESDLKEEISELIMYYNMDKTDNKWDTMTTLQWIENVRLVIKRFSEKCEKEGRPKKQEPRAEQTALKTKANIVRTLKTRFEEVSMA